MAEHCAFLLVHYTWLFGCKVSGLSQNFPREAPEVSPFLSSYAFLRSRIDLRCGSMLLPFENSLRHQLCCFRLGCVDERLFFLLTPLQGPYIPPLHLFCISLVTIGICPGSSDASAVGSRVGVFFHLRYLCFPPHWMGFFVFSQ